MNNNILDRHPLFETVKKHAISKNFLTAIICTFIYLGAACLLMGTLISVIFSLVDIIYELEGDTIISSVFYAILGFWGVMFIGSLIISIIQLTKLLSIRKFFIGKTNDQSGFEGIIKTTKALYLYSGIAGIIPIVVMIFFMLVLMISEMGIAGIIPIIMFVLPIYLAEIAGVIIFYYFSFKSIRQTVTYAANAANDIPEGKVSVFLIVITIISLASAAFLVMYSAILFIIGAIFSLIDPAFLMEFADEFAVFANFDNLFLLMPFLSIPMLISQICYVKLLFGFKKDMEKAKKEHAQIQQQKAVIEAQNDVAADEHP